MPSLSRSEILKPRRAIPPPKELIFNSNPEGGFPYFGSINCPCRSRFDKARFSSLLVLISSWRQLLSPAG